MSRSGPAGKGAACQQISARCATCTGLGARMARHAFRVAVLATATLAGTGSPLSAENSAPPPERQAHVNGARKECAGIDGGELRVDPGAYQKLDLTGDGRDDYLLDYSLIKCSTAEGYFSGTGGAPLVIFV